jgi:Do/DeqQ family serine protease
VRKAKRVTPATVSIAAAFLLVTGAAWHAVSADNHTASTQTVAATTATIAHAIAGSRDSYADVVKVVAPAVVTIRTEGNAKASPTEFQIPDDDFFRRFFGDRGGRDGQDSPFGGPRQRQPRSFRQRALGSGVIVTGDGYILTNNHVVDGADQIHVELTDGRTLSAKVVGTDKASDLALVKVTGHDFQALPLGNSDAVQVGDVVLAVGNPMGIGQTVTMGIISAKGRSTGVGDGGYEDFLQTDAPINHGNSGGALVSTKGELVGINSQILSESGGNIGIGFAIPSNMAKHVMDELRTHGKVTRAQLGVTVQGVTSEMAESLGLKGASGAIISSVSPDSAAERAGLKRGDVIRSFNGQPVHDTNTLRNRVAESGPGSTADILIVRDGAEKHVSVKLDEARGDKTARRDAQGTSDDKTALGISVAPLTPELADRFHAPKDAHGLVVEDVDPDGRAADAGMQAGDIIQEVNRQPVRTVDELRAAVRKTTDRPALLLVNRQGRDIFITVRPANG